MSSAVVTEKPLNLDFFSATTDITLLLEDQNSCGHHSLTALTTSLGVYRGFCRVSRSSPHREMALLAPLKVGRDPRRAVRHRTQALGVDFRWPTRRTRSGHPRRTTPTRIAAIIPAEPIRCRYSPQTNGVPRLSATRPLTRQKPSHYKARNVIELRFHNNHTILRPPLALPPLRQNCHPSKITTRRRINPQHPNNQPPAALCCALYQTSPKCGRARSTFASSGEPRGV